MFFSRTSHSCKQDDRQQILLDVLQEVKATPLSLGCHDSSESGSDEEECWLEDEDALRDEGVEVAPGSRLVPRHVSHPVLELLWAAPGRSGRILAINIFTAEV